MPILGAAFITTTVPAIWPEGRRTRKAIDGASTVPLRSVPFPAR
jgi:hypothetical protein